MWTRKTQILTKSRKAIIIKSTLSLLPHPPVNTSTGTTGALRIRELTAKLNLVFSGLISFEFLDHWQHNQPLSSSKAFLPSPITTLLHFPETCHSLHVTSVGCLVPAPFNVGKNPSSIFHPLSSLPGWSHPIQQCQPCLSFKWFLYLHTGPDRALSQLDLLPAYWTL